VTQTLALTRVTYCGPEVYCFKICVAMKFVANDDDDDDDDDDIANSRRAW